MVGLLLKEKPTSGNVWLSVSRIKTFKSCKLKYRYEYIDKLPKKQWEHFDFGNLIHKTLELFHLKIINGATEELNKIMTLSFKEALMDKKFCNSLKDEQKKEAFALLGIYLTKMAQLKKDNQEPKVIGAESTFYLKINDIVFVGVIDRIQIDPDGILHLGDYKTTKNKKYLKDDDFQLKTYAYEKFLEDPSLDKIRASYILIRHKFETIAKEYCREIVEGAEQEIVKSAEEIVSEKLWRASTGFLCKYCDFFDKCPEGRKYFKRDNEIGKVEW